MWIEKLGHVIASILLSVMMTAGAVRAASDLTDIERLMIER
jgi:hypothetical protein